MSIIGLLIVVLVVVLLLAVIPQTRASFGNTISPNVLIIIILIVLVLLVSGVLSFPRG